MQALAGALLHSHGAGFTGLPSRIGARQALGEAGVVGRAGLGAGMLLQLLVGDGLIPVGGPLVPVGGDLIASGEVAVGVRGRLVGVGRRLVGIRGVLVRRCGLLIVRDT